MTPLCPIPLVLIQEDNHGKRPQLNLNKCYKALVDPAVTIPSLEGMVRLIKYNGILDKLIVRINTIVNINTNRFRGES